MNTETLPLAYKAFVVTISPLCAVTLRFAWRNPSARKPWFLVAGWLLFAAGFPLWAQVVGPEFGAAYHLILVTLSAWLMVLVQAERRPRKQPKATSYTPSKARWFKRLGLFLLAGPIAGLASCILILALTSLLPIQQGNQLVVTVFTFPLLWAALAVWICASRKWAPHTLTLLATSAGSLGVLFG